ncbi:MAG: hypothetical protein JWQ49_1919 [Edaphobacter sp.]|nr:hypothetical protein [Edaphobacter sp.]
MQTYMGVVSIVDFANKRLTSLPDGFTTKQVEIMRGDLTRILYEANWLSTGTYSNSSLDGLFDDIWHYTKITVVGTVAAAGAVLVVAGQAYETVGFVRSRGVNWMRSPIYAVVGA